MGDLAGNRAENVSEAGSLQSIFKRLKSKCLAANPNLADEFAMAESLLADISSNLRAGDRLSYECLDAMVSGSLDAITVFDESGVCEYNNEAACKLLGWSSDELKGRDFRFLSPPELHQFYLHKLMAVLVGTQGPFEGEVVTRSGARRSILLSCKRFTVNGVAKILSISKDISELKESQKQLQLMNQDLDRLVSSRTRELVDTVKARDVVIGALQTSEKKFRDVVEGCGLLVITYGLDGRVIYVNDRSIQYIGCAPKDIIGKHISEFVTAEAAAAIVARINELAATGRAEDGVDFVMTPAGPKWFWGHPNVTLGADGKPESVTVFVQDITEKKLAELKLARSEAEYRQLVNYAGFIVVRCDIDGNIQFINDMGHQYLGRRQDDHSGQHITKVWGKNAGEVFMAGIRRALEKGKDIERELRMDNWPNGPRWLWSRFNLIRDGEGKPESVIFFAHDTTRQKLAELAHNESETNFRTFFESMNDMVIVCSPEGIILSANSATARTLGYSMEELIGLKLMNLHPHEKREEAKTLFGAILAGEQHTCSISLVRRDGSVIPVETIVWLGKWNGSRCVFGISRNLTAEHEARQRFEQLFHSNPVPMALNTIPDQRFEDVNNAFLTALGCTREEIIGRTVSEMRHFVIPEQQEAASRILMAEGRVAGIELQVRRKDGSVLDGIFSGEIIISHSRRYLLTAMMDITERKAAQARIAESEKRYQELIEAAGVSITVFDKDLRITLANAVSAVRFRKKPDEIIGKRLKALVSDESCRVMESHLKDALANNQVIEEEQELVLPVGRRWYQMRVIPLPGTDGRAAGVTVFAHDITEQKLNAKALQESENRRKILAETAMEAIFMHDNGVLLEANQRYFDIFGYTPEEAIGREMRSLTLTPESLAFVLKNAESGSHAPIKITAIRKDGTHFPGEMHGHNIVYKGRTIRIVALMDISDRVRAETELARLQERMQVAERLAAIGYVGANMAHEVNTPLSVMRLTAQMLISDLEKRGKKKENVDRAGTMLREIDRVAGIIRRYREMTRPAKSVDSDDGELRAVPARVLEVLASAAANAKLKVTIGEEVPELTAKLASTEDAEQLFFILIENAIQAADGKKWRTLDIRGKKADGRVELTFTDECCGIPPENIEKLFDPFFSTKPRDVGTGLGLCIAKRLLQERGGLIRVNSTPGKGSIFTVIYPARELS